MSSFQAFDEVVLFKEKYTIMDVFDLDKKKHQGLLTKMLAQYKYMPKQRLTLRHCNTGQRFTANVTEEGIIRHLSRIS